MPSDKATKIDHKAIFENYRAHFFHRIADSRGPLTPGEMALKNEECHHFAADMFRPHVQPADFAQFKKALGYCGFLQGLDLLEGGVIELDAETNKRFNQIQLDLVKVKLKDMAATHPDYQNTTRARSFFHRQVKSPKPDQTHSTILENLFTQVRINLIPESVPKPVFTAFTKVLRQMKDESGGLTLFLSILGRVQR